MFGRKQTAREDLIYADPHTAEKPVAVKGRRLKVIIAVLAAFALLALVVATLYGSIWGT